MAGLQPRANARRGLELNANSSVVWQPIASLGDRHAIFTLGFVWGLFLTSLSCILEKHSMR